MLSVQGLSKTFRLHRLGRDLTLFAGVEFTLRRGEFLLLQGQNGVGKSSLLKCIYGTYRPSAGKILLETPKGLVDVVQSGPRTLLWLRRHVVGYVSQFLEPRPRTTVLEVVMEPLLEGGVGEGEAKRRAGQALEALGLDPRLFQVYPTSLSGGERQKVNLARALVQTYPLLLLYEPTASLDLGAREALRERLLELKVQGVAMVGVFHHPDDVRGLVDRQYLLVKEGDSVAVWSQARSS